MLKRKLSAAAYVKRSRLIIALDLTPNLPVGGGPMLKSEQERIEREAIKIVSATVDYTVAYKINRHLVLFLGLFERMQKIIDTIHDLGAPVIMDCKINDIGDTNHWITRYYFDAGFDAVIANPIIGWHSGLDVVFKTARERKKGVILLCYMSHPGAREGYGLFVATDEKKKHPEPLYKIFAKHALKWDADGLIVGATDPEKISEVRNIVGDEIPILSPGIGAQGAEVADALQAGASYIIVGRSIVNADDPASAAEKFAEQTR